MSTAVAPKSTTVHPDVEIGSLFDDVTPHRSTEG
jgi:hypothetical protein